MNVPSDAAVDWPMTLPVASRRLIDDDGSAVPARWGWVTLVIPSPTLPESSIVTRPRTDGAAGAVVSIARTSGRLAALRFPAASVATAVSVTGPSGSAAVGTIE